MVLTIFLWTPAHFWALTLSKRRDYGEAGVPMLPVVSGEDTTRNYILHLLYLFNLELYFYYCKRRNWNDIPNNWYGNLFVFRILG